MINLYQICQSSNPSHIHSSKLSSMQMKFQKHFICSWLVLSYTVIQFLYKLYQFVPCNLSRVLCTKAFMLRLNCIVMDSLMDIMFLSFCDYVACEVLFVNAHLDDYRPHKRHIHMIKCISLFGTLTSLLLTIFFDYLVDS